MLLDATPLPTALAEYQWIDFQETVKTSHGRRSDKSAESATASVLKKFLIAGAAIVAILSMTGVFWAYHSLSERVAAAELVAEHLYSPPSNVR